MKLHLLCESKNVTNAAPIEIFNTGVDYSNNRLSIGSVDNHFTVLETASNAVKATRFVSGANSWVAEGTDYGWIGLNASGASTGSTYTFRTTFDLSNLDASTAVLEGFWAADNFISGLLLNGSSTGETLFGGAGTPYRFGGNFSVTNGFIDGLNTLDFIVSDNGGKGGLLVDFTSASASVKQIPPTPAPEPSILALIGLGLTGLVFARRRSSQG